MTFHDESSPLAGKTVSTRDDVQLYDGVQHKWVVGPHQLRVRDWWDRCDMSDRTSVLDDMSIAATNYAQRAIQLQLPLDDEVVYGHVKGLGHAVHVSELELPE